MPTSTSTFSRNVPPAICHTSYYPVRSSSSIHTAADLFVFFHLLINIWPCQTLHYFSRLLFLVFAQHLSAGLLPFLPLSANHLSKNLQSSSLIFCKPARVHAPAFDYLCIYYPWRYLSRTKKKDFVRKGGIRTPKNAVRSEQILYRSTNTRNNYYNQSLKMNFFFLAKVTLEL
jgi:hypothetical protein